MHFSKLLTCTLLFGVSSSFGVLVKRASLTKVSNWGSNPASLNMYIYVPSTLAASPGLVVACHGASGNAQQEFTSTPYATLADQHGFIVVYPESPAGAWDATSKASLTHNGGGASQSIANMASYAISTYKVNTAKVGVTGQSSGGTMANTMAGVYPDIFKSAVIYSAGYSGNIRSMYPSWTGTYPKVQTYLGSLDTIIGSSSFNTTLAAWASVFGYDTIPDTVQQNTPVSGWITYVYGSQLQGTWAVGVGHPVSVQGAQDVKWFGIA